MPISNLLFFFGDEFSGAGINRGVVGIHVIRIALTEIEFYVCGFGINVERGIVVKYANVVFVGCGIGKRKNSLSRTVTEHARFAPFVSRRLRSFDHVKRRKRIGS